MPSEEDAVEIATYAAANQVRSFDTAAAYQLSQHRLGLALASLKASGMSRPTVVTKVDGGIDSCATAAEVIARVDASISDSVDKLGLRPLDTVLLHQWGKHGPVLHEGAAYTRLKHHKVMLGSFPPAQSLAFLLSSCLQLSPAAGCY